MMQQRATQFVELEQAKGEQTLHVYISADAVSLVCMAAIVSLMYSEVRDFLYCSARFHFTPDGQLDTRMDLNVDITVAMPCRCESPVQRP